MTVLTMHMSLAFTIMCHDIDCGLLSCTITTTHSLNHTPLVWWVIIIMVRGRTVCVAVTELDGGSCNLPTSVTARDINSVPGSQRVTVKAKLQSWRMIVIAHVIMTHECSLLSNITVCDCVIMLQSRSVIVRALAVAVTARPLKSPAVRAQLL